MEYETSAQILEDRQRLRAENEALKHVLLRARGITWHRVSDSLPDAEITVLIAMDDGEVWTGCYRGEGDWSTVDAWPLTNISVTHWADLPAHPEAA